MVSVGQTIEIYWTDTATWYRAMVLKISRPASDATRATRATVRYHDDGEMHEEDLANQNCWRLVEEAATTAATAATAAATTAAAATEQEHRPEPGQQQKQNHEHPNSPESQSLLQPLDSSVKKNSKRVLHTTMNDESDVIESIPETPNIRGSTEEEEEEEEEEEGVPPSVVVASSQMSMESSSPMVDDRQEQRDEASAVPSSSSSHIIAATVDQPTAPLLVPTPSASSTSFLSSAFSPYSSPPAAAGEHEIANIAQTKIHFDSGSEENSGNESEKVHIQVNRAKKMLNESVIMATPDQNSNKKKGTNECSNYKVDEDDDNQSVSVSSQQVVDEWIPGMMMWMMPSYLK